MCLIGLKYAGGDTRLLLAANRDEFHDRPAAAAAWWPSGTIFGGRDLRAGGSWLACRADGRLAAVTNVRGMNGLSGARSRGELIARFLDGDEAAADCAAALRADAADYGPFNLLLYDGSALHYAANAPRWQSRTVPPGVHAISNGELDAPWPKVERLRAAVTEAHDNTGLFAALADENPATDDDLPDTGVGLEMERMLSPPFIRGARYGTRASTVVRIGGDGSIDFEERRFGPDARPDGVTRERFAAPPAAR